MHIWYVHGAGASELSFNWLRDNLPDHTPRFFTYGLNESVISAGERLERLINEPAILVGHSLGGIIATVCAEHPAVERLVTICTPFGGLRFADVISLFSFEPIFRDLRQYGPLLNSLRKLKVSKPHLSIVGTKGLPFIPETNDGVLTVTSQTALTGPRYEALPLNHFEVLLSPDVAKLVTEFIR